MKEVMIATGMAVGWFVAMMAAIGITGGLSYWIGGRFGEPLLGLYVGLATVLAAFVIYCVASIIYDMRAMKRLRKGGKR